MVAWLYAQFKYATVPHIGYRPTIFRHLLPGDVAQWLGRRSLARRTFPALRPICG